MSTPIPADDPRWGQLSAPFPAAAITKLPRGTCKACKDSPRKKCDSHNWINRCPECGSNHSSATIHLDYIGHADVTTRLDDVDPHWNWEPAYREVDPALLAAAIATGSADIVRMVIQNAPARYTDGGLWIRLTVLGVTRLGFGDADGKTGTNAVKELIGDGLRNGAMRFGVATYLWSKSEAAQALKDGPDDHEAQPEPAPSARPDERRQQRASRPPAQQTEKPPANGAKAADAPETTRALALSAARSAAKASTVEDLEKLAEPLPSAVMAVDVSAAITRAQRTAASVHEPRLSATPQVPLFGWLGACRLSIEKGGTSVADASAYDEPDETSSAEPELATTNA